MPEIVLQTEGLGKAFRLERRAAPTRITEAIIEHVRRLRSRPEEPEWFWALRDVSLRVESGEVLGLIGHNGAGKSTLLKILSRIYRPSTGRFTIRGRVGSLLEVGTGFHPELSGRDNIYLNGAILGMSRREIARKFDEIVAFAEADRFLDQPVKRYSSGMAVRLAFAVAAHLEPELLLVDEVLAVGDVAFQNKCLGRIQEVAKSGRTIVMVSHSVSAIQRLCHRVVVLDQGRAREYDSVSQGIADYLAASRCSLSWLRQPPAPSQPHVLRVSLCDAGGQPAEIPDSAGRFGIAVEYCLTRTAPGVLVAVAIENAFGTVLFSTASCDGGKQLSDLPGVYRIYTLFPEALLMPKRFRTTVALYSLAEGFDRVQGCLTFDVAEAGSLANSLPGGRAGELQILCDWSTPVRLG